METSTATLLSATRANSSKQAHDHAHARLLLATTTTLHASGSRTSRAISNEYSLDKSTCVVTLQSSLFSMRTKPKLLALKFLFRSKLSSSLSTHCLGTLFEQTRLFFKQQSSMEFLLGWGLIVIVAFCLYTPPLTLTWVCMCCRDRDIEKHLLHKHAMRYMALTAAQYWANYFKVIKQHWLAHFSELTIKQPNEVLVTLDNLPIV